MLEFMQVLELGMNFLAADDMSAILAVKLRKRLGFGMWTKLHLTGMHVEGKVVQLSLSKRNLFHFGKHNFASFLKGVDRSEVPSSMAFLGALTCVFCRASIFPDDC